MISQIKIENYKSIAKMSFEPGTLTVLIGENGSGKSNILEAITFAAAAADDKLDDEFLFNRGIRINYKRLMHSAFQTNSTAIDVLPPITFSVTDDSQEIPIKHSVSLNDEKSEKWKVTPDPNQLTLEKLQKLIDIIERAEELDLSNPEHKPTKRSNAEILAELRKLNQEQEELAIESSLKDFLIFSPENTALRTFKSEGAIKPLGTKGEGLLELLSDANKKENGDFISRLNQELKILGWFDAFIVPTDDDEIKGQLLIKDRYLNSKGSSFDQRSANEGFLYLLFYFSLMLSDRTPRFFAIDNIDNALNPKLCATLIRRLSELAKETGKQLICTTHNPAILDGLDLTDDQQKLYVVRRNSEGHTSTVRVEAPRPRPDNQTTRLSSAFISGHLGGLPDHF